MYRLRGRGGPGPGRRCAHALMRAALRKGARLMPVDDAIDGVSFGCCLLSISFC